MFRRKRERKTGHENNNDNNNDNSINEKLLFVVCLYDCTTNIPRTVTTGQVMLPYSVLARMEWKHVRYRLLDDNNNNNSNINNNYNYNNTTKNTNVIDHQEMRTRFEKDSEQEGLWYSTYAQIINTTATATAIITTTTATEITSSKRNNNNNDNNCHCLIS